MATDELSPLASEDELARRITYERDRRGWSPGGLASLMTKAGCPMNQSAIWKIENGEPRRKITVDEALAFAKVFELPLADLLQPPDDAIRRELAQELRHVETSGDTLDKILSHLERAYLRITELLDALDEPPASNPLPKGSRDEWMDALEERTRAALAGLRKARRALGASVSGRKTR